jgi:hypothetical protein
MTVAPSLRHAVLAVLLAVCANAGAADEGARVLQPFTTDGCSLFPDRAPDGGADWCTCCVVHDLAYWRGGTSAQRLASDEALQACVAGRTGNAGLARTMFLGVRAGGGPQLATSYRWGYGWPYEGHYRALSAEESARADALEQAYRDVHPVLACPTAAPAPPGTSAARTERGEAGR